MTAEYAKEREQFGRPIGSNQAVKVRVEVRVIDLGDGMGLTQWKLSGEPSVAEEWQVPAP